MSGNEFQPGPPAEVAAERDGDRWTLIFVRELRHAPETVWRALTDPAELRQWAPFDSDRNLGTTGTATLATAGAENEALPTTIRRAEEPRLLEYTWGEDVLRWELEPTANGTRLTLRHTVEDKPWLPRVAAGWHICLDVLDRTLAGAPTGRIVGHDAKQWWAPLNEAYSERLGIEPAPWPLEEPATSAD